MNSVYSSNLYNNEGKTLQMLKDELNHYELTNNDNEAERVKKEIQELNEMYREKISAHTKNKNTIESKRIIAESKDIINEDNKKKAIEQNEDKKTKEQSELENMKTPNSILEKYKNAVNNKYKVEKLKPVNKPIIEHYNDVYSDNNKSFNDKTDSFYKQIKTEFYKELKYNKELIKKYRTEEKTYSENVDYGTENDDTIIDNLLHQLDDYYKTIKREVLQSINVDQNKIKDIFDIMNLDINKSTIGGRKINKRKSKKNKKKNNKKNRSVKKNKSKKSRK